MEKDFFIILADNTNFKQYQTVVSAIREQRGKAHIQQFPRIIWASGTEPLIDSLKHLSKVESISTDKISNYDDTYLNQNEKVILKCWNNSKSKEYLNKKNKRLKDGKTLDLPEGGCHSPVLERNVSVPRSAERNLSESRPAFKNTSQYMTGRVAVGVVIVSGPSTIIGPSGSTTYIPTLEREIIVNEIREGARTLTDFAPAGANLSFAFDMIPPMPMPGGGDIPVVEIDVDPNKVSYDPEDERKWRDPAMSKLGYSVGLRGMYDYIEDLKTKYRADWAYIAYFTPYPTYHFAYAEVGGPRLVIQWPGGPHGPFRVNEAFAHETGHIFWAPDEYADSNCSTGGKWGYLNVPNDNCENDNSSSINCLMKNDNSAICEFTKGHFGWIDSDGDRIPDPIDTDQTFEWQHLSPIVNHEIKADFDCSTIPSSTISDTVVVGDFDGDRRDEVAMAFDAFSDSEDNDKRWVNGNNFWVMRFNRNSRTWQHLSRMFDDPFDADFYCARKNLTAKFAVVGDFDGDLRDEIAIAIGAGATNSGRNDFWVMDYDPNGNNWSHLSPIPGHSLAADFDCSGSPKAAKFAVVGDFDGDGRDEIAIAIEGVLSERNDFWVMKFDPGSKTWSHLSPIPGHSLAADFDCSGSPKAAKFAVVGDFDGDGRDEIAIAIEGVLSERNDFWVMKFDPGSKTWSHLSPIPGHSLAADFDCSGSPKAAKFAVVGDFDGDGRDEIAIAIEGVLSERNDFWVMKFDPGSKTWSHLSPIPGHSLAADFDCSGSPKAAKFATVGDYDGDGRDEIAIAIEGVLSERNDFWVMKFDPGSKTWSHLSPIPGHHLEADFDCSGLPVPAKLALSGNFDTDGISEIVIATGENNSNGKAFWVMDYAPQ